MTSGFPTYTHGAKQGERGVNLLSGIVHDEFGWLFKRNHQEHDFGIDAHIEVVQDDGAVTGQMLGIQIKHGASFTKEKNRWGYVYRGELKHFNYLSNYPLPVIIVLCDPESGECYWETFSPEKTTRTKSGWHMTVPQENVFRTSKKALLSLLRSSHDALSELEEYWALNKMIVDASRVFYAIDIAEVRSKSVVRVRDFIKHLCTTKELAYECQGKIEFTFSGYDDDPREVFEIEEVRQYVALLEQAIPNLLFFAAADSARSSLRIIGLCLTGVSWESDRSTRQVTRRVIIETKGVAQFLERQFPGLNEMTEWLGMSEDQNRRITYAVAKCVGFSTPEGGAYEA
ncbi:MAG: DUF4365 and DUF1817 domain-containing protein [Gallionella sp.]|nr:DUF4365 and DUF1817 domain-containing protein [Gallionella sp.]